MPSSRSRHSFQLPWARVSGGLQQTQHCILCCLGVARTPLKDNLAARRISAGAASSRPISPPTDRGGSGAVGYRKCCSQEPDIETTTVSPTFYQPRCCPRPPTNGSRCDVQPSTPDPRRVQRHTKHLDMTVIVAQAWIPTLPSGPNWVAGRHGLPTVVFGLPFPAAWFIHYWVVEHSLTFQAAPCTTRHADLRNKLFSPAQRPGLCPPNLFDILPCLWQESLPCATGIVCQPWSEL